MPAGWSLSVCVCGRARLSTVADGVKCVREDPVRVSELPVWVIGVSKKGLCTVLGDGEQQLQVLVKPCKHSVEAHLLEPPSCLALPICVYNL